MTETTTHSSQEPPISYRLDKYIADQTGMTRSLVKRMYESGDITIPKGLSLSCHISGGIDIVFDSEPSDDVVTVQTPKKEEIYKPYDYPLNVVYEDSDILILNKEAGISVHPCPGNWNETLLNAVIFYLGSKIYSPESREHPFLIHRLDKDTSGLIVFGKNPHAQSAISEMFAMREVSKKYFALCYKKPTIPIGRIENVIKRDPKNRQKMRSYPVLQGMSDGKLAVTNYKTIDANDFLSLIDVDIETGRTHQIRVHLGQNLKCPIVGDLKYSSIMPSAIQNRVLYSKVKEVRRQLLCSYYLSFEHPMNGETLEFSLQRPKTIDQAFSFFNL